MGSYTTQGTSYGDLMKQLMDERQRFDTEEEFQSFARDEVRKFITDLRSIDIELTMRPTYGGQPLSHHRVTQKLAELGGQPLSHHRATQKLAETDIPTINQENEVVRSTKRTPFFIPESRLAFYLFVLTMAGFIFLRTLTDQEIVVALGTLNIAIIAMWVWALLSKIRSLTQSLKYDRQNEPK
ncbi:MAG: hypothetical protein ACREBD_04215 [Blastocatellia bacterium]